ncbi:TIGR02677 family protein [Amycolatopsis sp. H20-H5]|uniref:TIGR02677 family protein n=1 Tax=Amycolatopsis sp. H20-H5 TaxID=3046309 RepID=UPI002DB6225F|nr:TIGR02677 family protein [Amycolatopsis sp. H20-H5]MEC3977963.1 TIGR02677 family protein [Amycolatopsis sp. H20-H5]
MAIERSGERVDGGSPIARVPAEMFRFTTGELSGLYTAILHAFGEANERLETALGLDDVRARLRSIGWFDALDDEDLSGALGKLRDWQLLDVLQNHAENYRTASEYERRNLQYSLTKRGEAAFAGVEHALSVLASSGALQTAVLDAISDRLDSLGALLAEASSTNRRIFSTLMELESHLDALRGNTKQFNGELQRLLRAEGADLTTFHEVKASTVTYLQEFLTNLDQRAHAISAGIERVEQRGVSVLQQRALLGAELPPTAGEDAGASWLEHRRTRWAGLCAWFRPSDGSPARVEQLHTVARRAIVTLLQVLDRITESRRRASSAVADFRELARWFAAAPSEADLHRLWATAFGLSSSRHAHLGHADPELISANTRWEDAPSVEVSALLRSSGRTERFTRTGKIRDVTAIKAARAELAKAERAELQAAWSLLATGGPVRLSAFEKLEHSVFQRLLDLLGRALSSGPSTDGTRRGVTSDGKVEILLEPAPDSRAAVLHTPRGRFAGPDFVVDIRVAGVRRGQEETG